MGDTSNLPNPKPFGTDAVIDISSRGSSIFTIPHTFYPDSFWNFVDNCKLEQSPVSWRVGRSLWCTKWNVDNFREVFSISQN